MSCEGCKYASFPRYGENLSLAKDVDILVIGDIPVAKEVYNGTPMQGPGAQILVKGLSQVGLDKCSIGWLTACSCAIPKLKNKTMSKDILGCRDTLLKRIAMIKPRSILLCGKVAHQIFTGDWNAKVTEKYGRMHEDWDIPVMTVYNPGVIVRSPNDYKPFIQMLMKFKKVVVKEELYDPGVTQWQVITEDIADKFMNWLRTVDFPEGHIIGADIETTDIDYRYAEFCVLGLSFKKNEAFVIPRELRHLVGDMFTIIKERGWKVCWQHGKYDKKVLWRRGLADISIDEDTLYLHYIIDETSEHNLGYLTKVYLNAEEYKFKMNQNFKAVTLETYDSFFDSLVERVAVDADYTLQVCHKLKELVEAEEPLSRVYNQFILPVANYLARLEQNGLLIDEDYLHAMDVDYRQRIQDILEDIENEAADFWEPEQYMVDMGAKTAPMTFNPGSSKQMSWMVFNKLELKPRVKKGTSTGADILESIENPPKLIELVLKYRGVKKEHSTYVLGLLKRRDCDGRIRPNFNVAGTATGRLSCKEPNVQNLPSYFGVGNIRRSVVAPKGYVLAEVDYSGAELRWLAVLSKDKNLTDIFVNNINLHDRTSELMYGPNFTDQDRMRAKAMNFGIMYGRQAQSFADEFNISKEEGQDLIDKWLGAYPDAKRYLEWCAEQVDTGNYIESPFGNRRRFGCVTNQSRAALHNESKNFAIQCSSSHMLLWCCVQLEAEMRTRGVSLINMVHDSVLMQIPADEETVCWATKRMGEMMCAAPKILFGTDVPFVYDVDMGVTWGDLGAFDHDNATIKVKTKEGKVKMSYQEWYQDAAEQMEEKVYTHNWYEELETLPLQTGCI